MRLRNELKRKLLKSKDTFGEEITEVINVCSEVTILFEIPKGVHLCNVLMMPAFEVNRSDFEITMKGYFPLVPGVKNITLDSFNHKKA